MCDVLLMPPSFFSNKGVDTADQYGEPSVTDDLELVISELSLDFAHQVHSLLSNAILHKCSMQRLLEHFESKIGEHKEEEPSPVKEFALKQEEGTCVADADADIDTDADAEFVISDDFCMQLAHDRQQDDPSALQSFQSTLQGLNIKAEPFTPMVPKSSLDSIPEDFATQVLALSASIYSGFGNSLQQLPSPEQVKEGLKQFQTSEPTVVETPKETIKEEAVTFEPKYTNHAKGNFYIHPDKVVEMLDLCEEDFVCDDPAKLAFSYYKESVAMQINDEQIRVVYDREGIPVIFIDIDLHLATNKQKFYLEARENDAKFVHRVRWKIVGFRTRQQIKDMFGIVDLPQSSRSTAFQRELSHCPRDMSRREFERVMRRTRFWKLPAKTGKPRNKSGSSHRPGKKRIMIHDAQLKQCCIDAFSYGRFVPVIVIKGKAHWAEWKMPVRVFDEFGQEEWVAISLRYYPTNKKWQVECMDYDSGRIYYQHRLFNLPTGHPHSVSSAQLKQCVTAELHIRHSQMQ